MRTFASISLLISFILIKTNPACAQWVETGGPYGGNIQCLAVTSNGSGGTDLFAGTFSGGLFLSTDNGTSWTPVNSGLTNTDVLDFGVSSKGIFAGTNYGLFLSTDNGANWTAVNSGLTNTYVTSLAVSGTDIFAGTNGGGVFMSTDNGTSWTAVDSGLTNNSVLSLAVSGTDIFAGTNGGGVFMSTDNGTSWTAVNSGLTNSYVASFVVNGTDIFAGTGGGGVFMSTDNGTSWTAVNSGLTKTYVQALAVSGTNIFAGTSGGLFLSTDNGSSWTAINSGLTSPDIQALAVSSTSIFAGTHSGGVFLSANSGTTWAAVNAGLASTRVNVFTVIANGRGGTDLFAGTEGTGAFLSTDNGTSWTAVDSGLTNSYVEAFAVSGSDLFAGTQDGVFMSTNDGTSWTAANSGITNPLVYGLAVIGTDLFAGTSGGGVFMSTDNGTSWTAVNSGLTTTSIYPLAVSGTDLFAGTQGGGVFMSTNDGTSWTAVNSGLTSPYIQALAVSGTDIFAGTNGGVYLSTDNGASWTADDSGFPRSFEIWSFSLGANGAGGTNIFAGTQAGGVFLSTNDGASWTAVDSGLTNGSAYAVAVNGTDLFIGYSYEGAWSRPLSQMVLPVPALISPANDTTNLPSHDILVCGSVTGATGYNWQVSTSPAFSSPPVNTSTSDTTFGMQSLKAGTRYYWRVQSGNSYTTSPYSSPDSFTIMAAPAAPTLASPANNAVNRPASLSLKVNAAANAAGYHWQLSATSTFSSTVVNDSTSGAGDTANTVSSLQNLTKYYWRVLAYDAGGPGSFSSVDSFTTIIAAASVPTPVSPVNNAMDQATSLTLKVNPAANAAGYRWEVSTSSSFSSTVVNDSTTGVGDTSNAVPTLMNLTKYYWRVLAFNAAGAGPFSSADSFTTIVAVPSAPAFPPSVPTTGVPRKPTFAWEPSANAAKYRVQLSSDSSFSTLIVDTTTTDTSVQIPDTLVAHSTYYWHVSAIDTAGASPYSKTLSFVTGTGITGIYALSGIPKTYKLMQNYPNPFNPSTTIRFDLKDQSAVTLSIYNILGQRVRYLSYGTMQAGSYDKNINMSEYASGVYFYRIVARGVGGKTFVAMKKMMMIK